MMVVNSKVSEISSSSSSSHGHRYDVFISFRGLDTRNGFTAYLHKALMDANITTFLDDEEIETGEDLKPELESAIKASRASVIVLSKNYATSTWCLDELVLILKQRMTSNHIVIPIFYHVEPTHVKKQQSSFEDVMAKHKQMMEAETNENKRSKWAQKIKWWNNALIEVADLKGKVVNGRLETEVIEEIVKDIYHRLHVPIRSPLPLLIGMDYSITFVTSWLKDVSSHTTDILTILGMGGIGKTSLAQYVYGLHRCEFEASSFIGNISRRYEQNFSGLIELQKQLYDDISKPIPIQVHDASIYTLKIENVVARKKVFLVLDDIDSIDQLDALLGSKCFHPGSKIIVTTKDAWLTESCVQFKTNVKPNHVKHLLQGLREKHSQELFCFHSFMSKDPKEGYEEVSEKLVKYCEGHPLALEVLGKSLYNRDVAYWEECIEGLEKEPISRINSVLRMSYDALPSKNDKDLFKHISCFFVGIDIDIAQTILKACGINTKSGITNLKDRCLLSVGWNNKLSMHGLIQKMGRFIVHQESPDKPWKRSRLWCHEESFKVLKQKKGKGNLLGLAFDMRMLEKEKLHASFEMKTDALCNMDNLMLLQLNYVQINGSYENFPEELRWLCMHGSPLKSIPSDLRMVNLVALDMSYGNIESLGMCDSNQQQLKSRQNSSGLCGKEKMLLGSLKILNLSFCKQLRCLSGFEELPALERLILKNCIGLLEVCESIEQCVELVLIDLSYCNRLEKLPRTLRFLKKVKTLLLDGCNFGEAQVNIGDLDSPQILKANKSFINTKFSPLAVMESIPRGLKFFAIFLPSSLVRLSLASNNLSTKSFPTDMSCLSMLKYLCLDVNPIISMPNCVRSLPRLEILTMRRCKFLVSVEHPPHTLRSLILNSEYISKYKPLLRKLLFDPKMSPLAFSIDWCTYAPSSFEFEGMVKIQAMADVEKKLLCRLGWTKIDSHNERHVGTKFMDRGREESEIQMYYEFGVFSTIYGGKKMPNWITHCSNGKSISFTVPSSPNKLIGLNFCYVRTPAFQKNMFGYILDHDEFIYLPLIVIENITKNCTWMYQHYIDKVEVGGKSLTLLSHWMFGVNEMESGDHVTINVSEKTYDYDIPLIKECGVSFVYDDGEEKEEEDVLGYYKSWNHIIGGDLTAVQLSARGYYLKHNRFILGIQGNFKAFS